MNIADQMNFIKTCQEVTHILKGKSRIEKDNCSVSLHRTFPVKMQGRNASSILGVSVNFRDLDYTGQALNFAEIAVLQQEVPHFTHALMQQGIIVSAIHIHWLFTDPPQIMYVHCQSVESPIQFAKKMAYAFTRLDSLPVS